LLEEYLIAKLVSDFNIKEICTLDYVFLNKFHGSGEPRFLNEFENRLNNAVDILKRNYDENHKKALILRYPEVIIPNISNSNITELQKKCLVNFHNLIMDESFRKNGNMLIILNESKMGIHQSLFSSSSNAAHLEITDPNLEARQDMIKFLIEKSQIKFKLDGLNDYNEVAKVTAGMTRRAIENIWRTASLNNTLSLDLIRNVKKENLCKEFDSYLEINDANPECGLDSFGGMNKVKDFLREGIINPIKEGNFDIIPKGLLFMGPPGTGKTFLAKCLANESGISFAEIKLSKFMSKWVGETEQNLEKIFTCLDSLSPVFVFIDEIEQVLQRGNEDSNAVRSNMFQMILNYMSKCENRGKVIWIAATNYPNKMDEALKRAGRFDIKLVFTPPLNENEIIEVINCQLSKIKFPNDIDITSNEFKLILEELSGYTQAEIESVIVKAISLCTRRKTNILTYNEINEGIKYIKRADNENIKEMLKIAINECNDLEFLPDELINENDSRYVNNRSRIKNKEHIVDSNNNIENLKKYEFLYNNGEKIELTDDEISLIFKKRMDNSVGFY
ncbi:MAG: ATP-binding protein, partial [Romboutsia sp.]|nr:ATP-binding protein [Romboutsia sp.]